MKILHYFQHTYTDTHTQKNTLTENRSWIMKSKLRTELDSKILYAISLPVLQKNKGKSKTFYVSNNLALVVG